MCTQAKRGRCSQDIGRMELGGTARAGARDRAWNEHHRVTRELKVTGQAGVRVGLAPRQPGVPQQWHTGVPW